METEHDDLPESEDEPALVVCAVCGHPNLEYRNHCRRCRESLHGGSNLIPGASLVEWSPTDAPGGEGYGRPRTRSLAMLFLLFAFGFSILMLATFAGTLVAVAAGIVGIWILASVLRSHRAASEAGPAADATEDAAAYRCPECGETVADIDDICPACGAIVAPDWGTEE